jgi:hypothetical protein
VLGFVALGTEVEVVVQDLIASASNGRTMDFHVKFTPTLLIDAEWRLLECYITLLLNLPSKK